MRYGITTDYYSFFTVNGTKVCAWCAKPLKEIKRFDEHMKQHEEKGKVWKA